MAEDDLNDLGTLTNLKELRDLVEFLKASGVTQFDMERPEIKIRVKFAGPEYTVAGSSSGISGVDLASLAQLLGRGAQTSGSGTASTYEGEHASAVPASPVPAAGASAEMADENAGLHIVKSPLVGTFYDAPSPGAEIFAKAGDRVELGKVLCIVEAMKIMNEIECDAAGEIVKVLVKTGQPVEYGQPLFAIRA